MDGVAGAAFCERVECAFDSKCIAFFGELQEAFVAASHVFVDAGAVGQQIHEVVVGVEVVVQALDFFYSKWCGEVEHYVKAVVRCLSNRFYRYVGGKAGLYVGECCPGLWHASAIVSGRLVAISPTTVPYMRPSFARGRRASSMSIASARGP